MANRKETEQVKDTAPEKDAQAAPEQAAQAAAEQAQPEEKKVKIRIPRTSKNQEDVFVSVNMDTYLIKRGVEVEVPEAVAEVLRNQEQMLEAIMEFEAENAK